MRWAYAAVSVLVALVSVALTAIVAGLPMRRVLEVFAVAAPVFFVMGWMLGRIGRATAEEMVEAEVAVQAEAEAAELAREEAAARAAEAALEAETKARQAP